MGESLSTRKRTQDGAWGRLRGPPPSPPRGAAAPGSPSSRAARARSCTPRPSPPPAASFPPPAPPARCDVRITPAAGPRRRAESSLWAWPLARIASNKLRSLGSSFLESRWRGLSDSHCDLGLPRRCARPGAHVVAISSTRCTVFVEPPHQEAIASDTA